MNINLRKYGIIWLVLSPLIFLMGVLTSEAIHPRFWAYLAVSLVAFIVSIAAIFKVSWSQVFLKYLSWLGSITYFISGLILLFGFMAALYKSPFTSELMYLVIMPSLFLLFSYLFYRMAKNLALKGI